jgi:hypothetical protein
MIYIFSNDGFFYSHTWGSSIIKELESQIIPKLSSQNVWECEKLTNIGKVVFGNSTLLTIANGG